MLTYKEAIKNRKSVRNYEKKDIDKETIEKIKEIINTPTIGPFGNVPRFTFIEKKNACIENKIKLGTYGSISNARYFIGGCIEKFEYSEVDYGYSFENIIIELTKLGLGTCCIGGTLNRKDYEILLDIKPGEIIPCITPVGYVNNKKRFRELFKSASSRKSPEMLFFENNSGCPLEFNKKHKYHQALEMLRLAPSSYNNQPWRVIKNDNKYHFYIKQDKNKPITKNIDIKKVDIGIALYHFKIATDELDLKGKWHINNPNICEWDYIISWIVE